LNTKDSERNFLKNKNIIFFYFFIPNLNEVKNEKPAFVTTWVLEKKLKKKSES
jgi:hypothetical protein